MKWIEQAAYRIHSAPRNASDFNPCRSNPMLAVDPNQDRGHPLNNHRIFNRASIPASQPGCLDQPDHIRDCGLGFISLS